MPKPDRQEFSDFSRLLPLILSELKSDGKPARDKALKMLAVCLARLIGLEPEGWLTCNASTGNSEVEMVATGKRPMYGRWLLHCLDTRYVNMDELATAIGRGAPFKFNTLLSVTTGHFTAQARDYVRKAMQATNYQILLMDADDLNAVARNERTVETILNS